MDVFKLFRVLIQASLLLLVLTVTFSFFGDEPPEDVVAYLDEAAGPLFHAMQAGSEGLQIVLGLLIIAYLLAWIASLIGLLGFRPWARTGYAALTIAGFPLMLLTGTMLVLPMEGALEALLNSCSGGLLVLLFTEPVRSRFQPQA